MIEEATVFILGAGASAPYGYPVGKDLRDEIIEHFVSDFTSYFRGEDIIQPFNKAKRDLVRDALSFVERFRRAHTQSIDLFLAGHAEDRELTRMGRLAIVFRVLAAERKQIMFRKAIENPQRDWYSFILGKLRDKLVTRDDFIGRFCENKFSIITFNYDRSLDHFLFDSLVNAFGGVTPAIVKEQLSHVKIIHVFGQIAGLPWQDIHIMVPYGGELGRVGVATLADNLKIIYDDHNNLALEEAPKLMAAAKRIFFLGFGYAEENLEILQLPKKDEANTMVYGTAFGLTENERGNKRGILRRVMELSADSVELARDDCDCLRLLRERL